MEPKKVFSLNKVIVLRSSYKYPHNTFFIIDSQWVAAGHL